MEKRISDQKDKSNIIDLPPRCSRGRSSIDEKGLRWEAGKDRQAELVLLQVPFLQDKAAHKIGNGRYHEQRGGEGPPYRPQSFQGLKPVGGDYEERYHAEHHDHPEAEVEPDLLSCALLRSLLRKPSDIHCLSGLHGLFPPSGVWWFPGLIGPS